ncbi:MAG: STAS domain-containing protein [Pseudomonadales bacterium]|nr:STAS domain-containing protein [Pseudomonadales bacterium]
MSEVNVIELNDVVDISKVETLLESMKKTADLGGEVQVDVSQVKRIDTAGLQLLFSFQETLKAQHGSVKISNPSDEFMNCARLVGFDKVLAFS